jgi:FKBP-type peptidyl-prolyl cis-trans isomerase
MKKLFLLTTAIAVCSASLFAQKKTDKKSVAPKTKAEPKEAVAPAQVVPTKPAVDYSALGFKRTETGLLYKIVNDAPGSKTPRLGDNVEVHINTHINDSLLFNSRTLNHNQPVGFSIMPPSFKGDLVEGLMMMTTGDSAVFLISVDSVQKSGAQLLPWMKSGDMIEYDVVLASVKTKEQVKAETDAKAAFQVKIDDSLLQAYFQKNKLKPTKTASGLYYVISKKGAGVLPKAGDKITVNYTGKTLQGVTFDSNVDSNFHHVEPFSFNVGQHQVIAGWDEGLMLMNKNCKATLYIPSTLAYGERGAGEKIPANSILIFDVEVTKIGEEATDEKKH